ncbi:MULTISPECIES: sigma-70 family RNA polymerase sigma factor [Flavobacterium]|uniref:Sigma-70 family RNA polymerase sigma factor n=1 Tax=Flavobacterium endoglycinae TaxID=2816357 RepID=A0ABX7Q863_9FLAO|nr:MULTISPECIES: sigma-70 family RNA polymerase sigma factor [Flavobacterium]QSW87216.1 sigma-70 family RNA polymerase sigma factor [Flavobacterium endoglycinae]
METISDNDLLKELKTGESKSYRLLYKFYFPSVASYIKQNNGNIEDAEDIFQEAIMVLFQKVKEPQFVLTSSLKTYLYAISKNLWLKKLRDTRIKIIDDEQSLSDYKKEVTFLETESENLREEKLENWLQKITSHCQNIIRALFFYEVPMQHLMVKMGWKNPHSASNQKHKCIQQIKKVKEDEA